MTNLKSSRSVWEAALDCLSRRALTNKELEAKLKEKDFKSPDIDRTLTRLNDLGYLNDLELALMYSQSRLKRYSKLKVFHDLKNRGLAPQIIEQAIEETYSSDEEFQQCLALAKHCWERENRRWEQKNMEQRTIEKLGFSQRELWIRQKVARRLFQRGYPSDMVRSVLNEIKDNNI